MSDALSSLTNAPAPPPDDFESYAKSIGVDMPSDPQTVKFNPAHIQEAMTPPPPPPAPKAEGTPAPDPTEIVGTDIAGRPITRAQDTTNKDMAKGVAYGAVDLVQGIYNTGVDMAQGIEHFAAAHGMGTGDLINDSAHLDWSSKVGAADDSSATRVARGITHYGLPVAALMASGAGPLAAMAGSAGIDFSVMDPHQERLSSMILNQAPELKNVAVVGNALTALGNDPKESNLAGRFKNTIEGGIAGLGIMAGAKGLSAIITGGMQMSAKAAQYIKDFVSPQKIGAVVDSMAPAAGEVAPEIKAAASMEGGNIPMASEADLAAGEAKMGANAPEAPMAKPEPGTYFSDEPIIKNPTGGVRASGGSSKTVDFLTEYVQANPQAETARIPGGVDPEEVKNFMNDESKVRSLLDWKQGDRALTDLEMHVAEHMKNDITTQWAEAAQKSLAEGFTPESMATVTKLQDAITHVQNIQVGSGSQAGASLNAQKIIYGATGQNIEEFAQSLGVEKRNKMLQDALKLSGGEDGVKETIRKAVAMMDAGVPMDEAMKAVAKEKGIFAKATDIMSFIAHNGMISGMRSVSAPTLSRAIMAGNNALTNATAGVLGSARNSWSLMMGGEGISAAERITMNQQQGYIRGVFGSMVEQVSSVGNAIRDTYEGGAAKALNSIKTTVLSKAADDIPLSAAKLGIAQGDNPNGFMKLTGFLVDKFGQAVGLPSKIHGVASDFFTDAVRRGKLLEITASKGDTLVESLRDAGVAEPEIAKAHENFMREFSSGFTQLEDLTAQAKAKGLNADETQRFIRQSDAYKGMSKEDFGAKYAEYIDATKQAQDYAQKTTFTKSIDNVPVVGMLNKMPDELDKVIPGAGPLARVAMPFLKINANIVMASMEHSLAGALLPETRAALFAGGKQTDVAVAKIVNGSAFLGVAAWLASEGVFTGPDVANPKLKGALQESGGWKPDSFHVGGDYYSVHRLAPMVSMLRLGSVLSSLHNYIKDPNEYQHMAAISGAAVAQFFSPETLVDNLSRYTEAYNQAASYGEDKSKVASALQDYASRFIPFGAVTRDIKNVMDPYKLSVQGSKNLDTFTDKLMRKYESMTPFLSDKVAVDRNLFGEAIAIPPGVMANMVNPVAESKGENSDLVKKLQVLGGYFQNMGPHNPDLATPSLSRPPRFIKVNGVSIDLNPKEYEKYQLLSAGLDPETEKPMGTTLREAMETRMDGIWPQIKENEMTPQRYNQLMGAISDVVSGYRQNAKNIMMRDPDIVDKFMKKKQRTLDPTNVSPSPTLGL